MDSDRCFPVAAAIIVHDGLVLLIRRRVAEGELSWQFPAGKVEHGETAERAAVRETREEVGLDVSAVANLGERVHPATGRAMIYVACTVNAGTARVAAANEVAEVEWCSRARLAELVPSGLFGPVQEFLDARLT
ncbi:NUDIX hydrolase [Nonomuraea sp. NPDC050790]|uniref:NUDIX hydrolase n=1 Tax=Nonomuraea sp. NPDC050790 TaxID=3364371 RepID=UPI0037A7CECB